MAAVGGNPERQDGGRRRGCSLPRAVMEEGSLLRAVGHT